MFVLPAAENLGRGRPKAIDNFLGTKQRAVETHVRGGLRLRFGEKLSGWLKKKSSCHCSADGHPEEKGRRARLTRMTRVGGLAFVASTKF